MRLQSAIEGRDISEVVHFTTNRGLVGILKSGHLLSRPFLNMKETKYLRYVIKLNASIRPEEFSFFDKSENWIRFVNLSISEINKRFFDVSRKWHNNENIWWCILAFDPLIMLHEGVRFTTTNNSYDQCYRSQGIAGFEAMFAPTVSRKAKGVDGNPWLVDRGSRPIHLPTCEQAEVLYPERLCLDYLIKVYVGDGNRRDIVIGWLRDFEFDDIPVVVKPEKFVGEKN